MSQLTGFRTQGGQWQIEKLIIKNRFFLVICLASLISSVNSFIQREEGPMVLMGT
jgi:hypothetical protein